jgi:cytochrome c553
MRTGRGIAFAIAALGVAGVVLLGAGGAGAQQQQKKPAAGAPAKTASAPTAPSKAVYAERFAGLCAACHGANGRSDMAGTPALAGQHSFYAITQLFLFREGRRPNEAMTAVAKTLKDDDLRGFSEFIGTLPPVPPSAPATPPDAAIMSKGQALARQHKCVFCHGDDLAGGQQVPRIGGQREDYVLASLKGFKDGTRPGYTQAMTEAMSQVPAADIEPLAYYVARTGPAPGSK